MDVSKNHQTGHQHVSKSAGAWLPINPQKGLPMVTSVPGTLASNFTHSLEKTRLTMQLIYHDLPQSTIICHNLPAIQQTTQSIHFNQALPVCIPDHPRIANLIKQVYICPYIQNTSYRDQYIIYTQLYTYMYIYMYIYIHTHILYSHNIIKAN